MQMKYVCLVLVAVLTGCGIASRVEKEKERQAAKAAMDEEWKGFRFGAMDLTKPAKPPKRQPFPGTKTY
jgi:hypothetical protein